MSGGATRIGQAIVPEFTMEMAGSRRVLERLPDDKLDWKIHEKSNTIGWVANHLLRVNDIPVPGLYGPSADDTGA